jgi:DNA-binding NtrC family response regulator
VRAAQGGTLLLDEIADLPLTAQTRLLRLLEEREVQPVGYARPVRVDVRIITATSSDLHERVQRGLFRQDLLFRLDVLRVHLRPLRERRAEILPLLAQFNAEFASLYRQHALRFSASATRVLEQHAWPGNVREVRTLVERLHVLCGTPEDAMTTRSLTAEDLASYGQMPAHRLVHVGPAAVRLQELKIEAVNDALSACRGNMSEAAATLGVHRSTLYRWLANEARAAV